MVNNYTKIQTRTIHKTMMKQLKDGNFKIYDAGGILLVAIGILIAIQANILNNEVTDVEYSIDLMEASIEELQIELDSGRITSVELVEFYLARIEAFDKNGPALNSIAYINPLAREEAQALDQERQQNGKRGPLHGIPILVKDNYETRGMPTTAGSKSLAGFAPDRDAELVARLRAAGAIILGKTNMHEFAAGIETWGSTFGKTRNPYDPERNPGGSSGGSGAAVAANFAVASLGSDTCGSIRIPASHNSLVGLRGTQGSSSRCGIIPLSSTQDIGGPLARSITDLALILDITVGHDPEDPQTTPVASQLQGSFMDALDPDALSGKRIGIVSELRYRGPEDRNVASVFDTAMEQMEALGVETVTVSLPILQEEIYQVFGGFYVLLHDFNNNINSYLSSRPEAPVRSMQEIIETGLVNPDVQGHLQTSLDLQNDPGEIYLEEFSKRERLKAAIHEVMERYELDALAYPTIRRIAALINEEQSNDNCHLAGNSGFPAITVPAGFSEEGMPVGLELLGRPWDDARLVGMAYAFEQATQHRRAPILGN
jgi:amidase